MAAEGDEEFVGPLFKRLTLTDANKGNAHTSGPTLTKPIRGYFPDPSGEQGRRTAVEVILINDDAAGIVMVSSGPAVVQIQGSPAETYLSEVQPLRKFMQENDLLLIEPSVSSSRSFRITRVAPNSPRFVSLNAQAVGSAGLLKNAVQPPSGVDLANATSELNTRLAQPFVLFDAGAVWLPAGKRIARSRAFVAKVLEAYNRRCAFCGLGAKLASGRSEVQAAHIVSRGKMGADDARNGLALCRVHHWAFDEGEIRVDADLTIRVNPTVAATPENWTLSAVDGAILKLPLDSKLHPHADALNWHRTTIAFK